MAIVNVSKFNLLCLKDNKDNLMNELQKFSEINFNILKSENNELNNYLSKHIVELDININRIEKIISILDKYEDKKTFIENLKEERRVIKLDDLIELEKNIENLDKLELIENKISELNDIKKQIDFFNQKRNSYNQIVKLDVSLKEIKSVKTVVNLLMTISKKDYDNFVKKDFSNQELLYNIELINEESKQYHVFVTIYKEKYDEIITELKKAGFMEFVIDLEKKPKQIIDEIDENLENYRKKIELIKDDLKYYSNNFLNDLKKMYEVYSNLKLKETETEKFIVSSECINLVGYIPESRKDEFEKIVSKVTDNVNILTYEKIEDSTEIPIKIKNNKIIRPFELLTSIYAMPKYQEIDPTPYLAPFFFVFFGMMVADMGYGILLLLLSFIGMKFLKFDKGTKGLISLFFILSFSVIIWGAIYASFFGIEIYKPLISITSEYNTVLLVSIAFGIFHIYFGIFLKAVIYIKNGQYLDIVYDCLSWIVCLTTTLIILLVNFSNFELSSNVMNINKYLMIISMIIIVLTGGREYKNIGGRIGFGVYALYGITGFFGDFISYARLMALGLSGAYMATSINQIARDLSGSYYTIIFAGLVFVLAHFMNIFLSMLSSYVHTSRLIYVEFFGKFYEGGGKPFKDFKIKNKYYDIEN